ncbi:bifunctional folylpolyglutamate synthase/dihydrofolate synthase [Ningiella sp. W23]|uniref:bifunctional folylpolyglutamate synthase/dihydrofolate synthase n=1 Tax=Ningiella sp. W23 TaxID=3023715 RepID=UPI00375735F4
MKRSLTEWLSHIQASHPSEIDMGLSRVGEVANRLKLDFSDCIVVGVAGTNGKGTTCRMIETVCASVGLSLGVYSSPHILRFNERIRLNQDECADYQIINAFERIERAKSSISLTYFEYATLGALLIFNDFKPDIILLEVGLGGRLDATNIVDADLAVLTSIGLDHQDYLGDTLEEIALEKAGIVKAHKRVVIGYADRFVDAENAINEKTKAVLRRDTDFFLTSPSKGHIKFAGKTFDYAWSQRHIPQQNVMTALASLWSIQDLLKQTKKTKRGEALNECLVDSQGIARLIAQTRLPGRAQLIEGGEHAANILLDVAHNEASANYLVSVLCTYRFERCHIVVGMLKDKNIKQTLLALNRINGQGEVKWYCASLPGSRGEQGAVLQNILATDVCAYGELISAFDSVEGALNSAIKQASIADIIVAVGSFVTVANAAHVLGLDWQ